MFGKGLSAPRGEWVSMRDDPRTKKQKALAAGGHGWESMLPALAAIERVRQCDRAVPVFTEEQPIANQRRAIAEMMGRGPRAWSMREREDDPLPLSRVRRDLI
jgi:hypothetical protein